MGGSVRRWRAALAASVLAIATTLVAGSCWNPLNWALQTWAYLDMEEVQGGTLMLGDVEAYGFNPDESPAHWVTVSTFLMSRYEVNQQLYTAVMAGNPSWFQYANGYTDETCRPVDSVTWQEAILFCNALSRLAGLTPVYTIDSWTVTWNTGADGYRLPTEAEWEYAARGGQDSGGYDFAGSDNENEVAWYPGNSTWDAGTASYITNGVGWLGSNELGLHDMSGNVCEWVWDVYSPTWYADNTDWIDPRGPTGNTAPINQAFSFVARGGSTNSAWDLLRSAQRFAVGDTTRFIDFGFRVARNW